MPTRGSETRHQFRPSTVRAGYGVRRAAPAVRPSVRITIAIACLGTAAVTAVAADSITLTQAIERALARTSRGAIIRGDVEVANDLYEAERINFYVPSISINGSLPAYNVDESYRFFGGSSRKRLYKTRGLDLVSFIRLEQSLITGGTLDVRANLTANDNRYPDTDPSAAPGAFLDETTRQGYFSFNLEQPLLRRSAKRQDLADRRDDLALARLRLGREEMLLSHEVTEAFLGLMQARLKEEETSDRLEEARLLAAVDSVKWQDGVISEESWLSSSSKRLEAELTLREGGSARAEIERRLALLLEEEPLEAVNLVEPEPPDQIPAAEIERLRENREASREVLQAEAAYAKARRSAEFAASEHGLAGDLKASYAAGRGRVKLDGSPADEINTNGWEVALNVSYPVWDGGAASAQVRAARFEADRARLELERARQAARVECDRLLDQIEVGRRRREILLKQVDLATDRLEIAIEREKDGRITRAALLGARAEVRMARGAYLEALKTYLVNRTELFSRFGS